MTTDPLAARLKVAAERLPYWDGDSASMAALFREAAQAAERCERLEAALKMVDALINPRGFDQIVLKWKDEPLCDMTASDRIKNWKALRDAALATTSNAGGT